MEPGIDESLCLHVDEVDLETVACRFFAIDACNKGDNCPFPHIRDPTRLEDKVCRFYLAGNCRFGEKCWFEHVKFESKEGKRVMVILKDQVVGRKLNMQESQKSDYLDSTNREELHGNLHRFSSEDVEKGAESEANWISQMSVQNVKSCGVSGEEANDTSPNKIFPNYQEIFPSLSEATERVRISRQSWDLEKTTTPASQAGSSRILYSHILKKKH